MCVCVCVCVHAREREKRERFFVCACRLRCYVYRVREQLLGVGFLPLCVLGFKLKSLDMHSKLYYLLSSLAESWIKNNSLWSGSGGSRL